MSKFLAFRELDMIFLRWLTIILVVIFLSCLIFVKIDSRDSNKLQAQDSNTSSSNRIQDRAAEAPSQVLPSMTHQDSNRLAKRMAVATYYQLELERTYGRALVSIDKADEDILQVSMVNIPKDRRDAILDSGLYEKAKGAKFRSIKFIDAAQNTAYIAIQ